MQQYLERLQQARIALFQEASKKRAAPSDLLDSDPKRIRTAGDAVLGSDQFAGPTSVSELFTLTSDPNARNFNISALPSDVVRKILVPILKTVNKARLDAAAAVSEVIASL